MGLVGRILPWSRGWAGVPLSPTASASPVLVTSAGFAFPMLWYSTGPAGPVLALLPWTAEPPFSSHRSGGGGGTAGSSLVLLLQERTQHACRGPELRCAGEDCSRGDATMQQSSRKSPWPQRAFPCQLHFTWLQGESCSPARLLSLGGRRAGQGLQQGLGTSPGFLPLLPAQPWVSGRADE